MLTALSGKDDIELRAYSLEKGWKEHIDRVLVHCKNDSVILLTGIVITMLANIKYFLYNFFELEISKNGILGPLCKLKVFLFFIFKNLDISRRVVCAVPKREGVGRQLPHSWPASVPRLAAARQPAHPDIKYFNVNCTQACLSSIFTENSGIHTPIALIASCQTNSEENGLQKIKF